MGTGSNVFVSFNSLNRPKSPFPVKYRALTLRYSGVFDAPSNFGISSSDKLLNKLLGGAVLVVVVVVVVVGLVVILAALMRGG